MKEEELRRCQIQEWYPIFKPYSIPTLFHPLPDDYRRYILGESPAGDDDDDEDNPNPPLFRLPSVQTPLPRSTIDPTSILDSDSDSDDSAPSFPTLESSIQQSISLLGGAVFPKLNWSSPKDAAWITHDRSLRCTSFTDISLLLHSSDRAVHDLCHAADSCSDRLSDFPFFLALRKFYPGLRPEMEFRCFVRGRRLIGISQREVTAYYPSLAERKRELGRMVEDFFDEVVGPRFGSDDYTFDVYVNGNGKIKLVDFNPWGVFTLPLLFSWEELEKEGFGEEEDREEVEFRLVESQCGVRPGLNALGVPYDYFDTAEGSGWDQFFKKTEEMLRLQMKEDAEMEK